MALPLVIFERHLCDVEGGKVKQRQGERYHRKFGNLDLLELLAQNELFTKPTTADFDWDWIASASRSGRRPRCAIARPRPDSMPSALLNHQ